MQLAEGKLDLDAIPPPNHAEQVAQPAPKALAPESSGAGAKPTARKKPASRNGRHTESRSEKTAPIPTAVS